MWGKAATPAWASGLRGCTGELVVWGGYPGATEPFAWTLFPAEPGPPDSLLPLVTTPGLRAPGRRRGKFCDLWVRSTDSAVMWLIFIQTNENIHITICGARLRQVPCFHSKLVVRMLKYASNVERKIPIFVEILAYFTKTCQYLWQTFN